MYKLIIFLLFCSASVLGQNKYKYLVLLKDKANNTYSLDKPLDFLSQRALDRRKKNNIKLSSHDLPPSKTYIDQLKAAGATVWYQSRWLNAALVLADSATAKKILALPFVKGFENNGPLDLGAGNNLRRRSKFEVEERLADSLNYGNNTVQSEMIGVQNLHNVQYLGQNMLIAVMDDGFNKVDKNTTMKHLFDNKKILSTFDFVRNTASVYDVGGHGALVLSCMAPYLPGRIIGTAPRASYALFRTEDGATEKIIEEANYLFAAEKADSLGADLINTSLGYNTYDYSPYNHTLADINGDNTLVTRAADWAAQTGILVCVSAGNSGNTSDWPYVGSPADGDSVIAVGAVTAGKVRVSFSSIGPTADGRIKPDIAAMGSGVTLSAVNNADATVLTSGSGTSFSGPIFCGFAACFWQLHPEMTMMQVREALLKLGSQAKSPDNKLGYGIPYMEKISILGLSVWPNPSHGSISFNAAYLSNESAQVQISNIYGRQYSYVISRQNNTIDVTNLAAGLYIGKFTQNNSSKSFRFIKIN